MLEAEVKLIMGFPKRDIATALVRLRDQKRRNRRRVMELENQLEDIVSGLGLLHENAVPKDIMDHIHRLTGALTDTTDEVESVVEHMDS